MSFTKRTTLDDTWTALTEAGATGIAQIQQTGPVYLHLGDSVPGATEITNGDAIVLYREELEELPFAVVDVGDILYGRAKEGETGDVVVMATGDAPGGGG